MLKRLHRTGRRAHLETLSPLALGTTLALLAYALLACQDAVVKRLVADLPVLQILCVRSGFIVATCLVAGGPGLLRRAAASPVKGLLAARSAVSLAAWLCYFTAARTLPLSQLTTLYFTAPVMVVLLAVPMLGETFDRRALAAVTLGFCGAAAACDPASLSVTGAAILVLVGAVFWAGGMVLMQRIGRREASLVQLFANNVLFFVTTAIGSLLHWQALAAAQIVPLLGMGVLGGLGQFVLTESARLAPVSRTAPLQYSALVWAFALGYLFWGSLPGPGVYLGAALILTGGLLVMRPVVQRTGSGKARRPLPESRASANTMAVATSAPRNASRGKVTAPNTGPA